MSDSQNCNSAAISNCKQVKAYIDCIPTIFQGETKSINIQLLDEENLLLDLSLVEEIHLILYDSRNEVVGEYFWPFDSALKDIFILQEDTTEEVVNKGLIEIIIDDEVSLNSIEGGLYSEIKLSSNINTFGSEDIIISCLLLGKIKSSKINMFAAIAERNNPDNWEENRIR